MELFVLAASLLHQPVLDLALLPGTFVPVARSHSFAPLRACAGRTKHVQRRVQSLLANIPIARPCGRSCVFSVRALSVRRLLARLLRSFSTWFRRVSDVAVAVTATSSGTPICRGVLTATSLLHTSLVSPAVGVSRARHRLSVNFEMPDLCCCDVMSRRLEPCHLAPSMANSTLNSAQFVCLSRCHHSSCLFMNCLFEQLDTVGVSARPRVNVLHWQRS